MKIYPVSGRLVRDPVTGREITDPDGVMVPDDDSFWIRRLSDGDVSDKPVRKEKEVGNG